MAGWTPKPVVAKDTQFTIAPSLTTVAINKPFPIYSGGALNGLVVGIFVSGLAGTATVQLQHAFARDVWTNVTGKSVALADGMNYISINGRVTADQDLMPLYDSGRLVITTDGSGAGTIEYAGILQES